jgi:4-amino-4-deoxy-L-arabinose transferase-like glycosyltransferase
MVVVSERVRGAARSAARIGERARSVPRDGIVALGLLGVALALNLYRLGTPPLWYDEALSVSFARGPLHGLLATFPAAHMVVYYTILFGWIHALAAFGVTTNEILARLPSAIFAALSVGVVFALGQRFANSLAGAVAAMLYLLNFYQLQSAQTARAYSLQLLLVCVAWYAWLALVSRDVGRRWWVVYVVASILACLAQLMTLFSLLAQTLVFAGLLIAPSPWRDRARSRLLGMISSLVAISGAILPFLYTSMHAPRKTLWVPIPRLPDVRHLYVAYLSSNDRISQAIILALGAAALLLALFRLLWKSRGPGGGSGRELGGRAASVLSGHPASFKLFGVALVSWLIIPVMVAYAVSQVSVHVFSERYLVEVLPAVCLLVGLVVAMFPKGLAQSTLALGLVAATLLAVPHYYANAEVSDIRTPTGWLVQHYQPGDGLVCHFGHANRPGCPNVTFEYYLYALHADQLATDAALTAPSTASMTEVARYVAQHPRFFYVTGEYENAADLAAARAAQSWLDSHYTLIGQSATSDGSVRLYSTGAGNVGAAGGAGPGAAQETVMDAYRDVRRLVAVAAGR